MEGFWETTWWEEMLFVAFILLTFFSLILFVYALGVTVMVCADKYPSEAAGIYWLSVMVMFIISASGFVWTGILFYIFSSPVVAYAMRRLERQYKLRTERNGTE